MQQGLTQADLFRMIEEQPPYFGQRPIKAFDETGWKEMASFIQEHIWENEVSLNVFLVTGTRHPDYQGMTWLDFLHQGKRMPQNLRLLEENPHYYRNLEKKLPVMSYIQIDGGDYYVDADGNHRTCLARCLFHFTQGSLMHGVEVNRYRLDHEAITVYRALTDRGFAVRPLSRKLGREDNPGWMRETFAVEFEIGVNGQKLMFDREEARQILARPQGWWSRFLKRLGN